MSSCHVSFKHQARASALGLLALAAPWTGALASKTPVFDEINNWANVDIHFGIPAPSEALGGPARNNVLASFDGIPWANYDVLASNDGVNWSAIGTAPESVAGHYSFQHSTADSRQFFKVQPTPPTRPGVLAAHRHAGVARMGSALADFGLATNFESMLEVENTVLDLDAIIEQCSEALSGPINVVDLPNNQFHVSWAGNGQVANSEQERDQVIQFLQEQEQQLVLQQQSAESGLEELSHLILTLPSLDDLLLETINVNTCFTDSIAINLPLPPVMNICDDALFCWLDLEALNLKKKALERKKRALQKRIQKLRDEAARKRRRAAMPVTVFGMNGTWFVRWSGLEFTYGSEEQARNIGVESVNVLKRARLREADELDAKADALEAELQKICEELEALCLEIALTEALCEEKAEECEEDPGNEEEEEFDDDRAEFRSWIDFDSKYLDYLWQQMFLEWQKRKDAMRQRLIDMGSLPGGDR